MNLKPIKLKTLLLYVVVTFIFAGVGVLLGGNTAAVYETLVKPPLSPPSILFPIVWSILYTLMGISAYILSTETAPQKALLLKAYWVQLALNALWPLVFWRFKNFTIAAIIIVAILAMVAFIAVRSIKINPIISILLLPYILWLLFALYLNIGFAILN